MHSGIGKLISQDKLKESLTYFIDAIIKAKPKGPKGNYLKDIYILQWDPNKNKLQIKINLTLYNVLP